MYLIGLRYCGGCNPEIDRTGLVEHLQETMKRRGFAVKCVLDKEAATDLILLINGCKHACLEQEFPGSGQGPPIISVRGEMVGDRYVQERDLPEVLMEEIMREKDREDEPPQ